MLKWKSQKFKSSKTLSIFVPPMYTYDHIRIHTYTIVHYLFHLVPVKHSGHLLSHVISIFFSCWKFRNVSYVSYIICSNRMFEYSLSLFMYVYVSFYHFLFAFPSGRFTMVYIVCLSQLFERQLYQINPVWIKDD